MSHLPLPLATSDWCPNFFGGGGREGFSAYYFKAYWHMSHPPLPLATSDWCPDFFKQRK